MKDAKYYSLRRAWNHGLGFRPVAITSERGGRWFGRDLEHNFSTNGAIRDLVGYFASEDAVKGAVKGLQEIAERHKPVIDAIEEHRKKAQRDWNTEEREFVETFARERAKENA